MFSNIKIEQLLQRAEDLKQADHDADEAKKRGVLRGGNSGILTDEGEIFGHCHRLTLARYLGVSGDVDRSSHLYFSAGHANEEIWRDNLERIASADTFTVLREGEAPTRWFTGREGSSPVPVTGSPDFTLVEPEEDYRPPVYGPDGSLVSPAENFTARVVLELKKICSSWRAGLVFIKNQPTSDHLIQLAHYSWQHKCPGILSYTSDSSYDRPYYLKKLWPEDKIPPGRKHYYTAWDGDTFCYINPDTAEVVYTKITVQGIERFYQLVLEMEAAQDLGPRPAKTEVYGDLKALDPCGRCDFAHACKQYDRDASYTNWLDNIQQEDFSDDGTRDD